MIREDRPLGRCENHDTEEEPGSRLPLKDTATVHLYLGVKSGVRRSAGWRSRRLERKVQIKYIYVVFVVVCLFKKKSLCSERDRLIRGLENSKSMCVLLQPLVGGEAV